MHSLFGQDRSGHFPLFATLILLLLFSILIGLCAGPIRISVSDILSADPAKSELAASVLWDLRLPRAVLAGLVGGALALSGAAMQGLFRNPLADPGLVGVASGSALAAVLAIVAAQSLAAPRELLAFLTPAASFAGGVAAAILATRLATFDGWTRTASLLMAGLAINAIAGAGIGLLMQLAGDSALREATFWLFGSLGKSGWQELMFAAPVLLAVMFLLPRKAASLNTLLLGEAEAGHLGVNVQKLKRDTLLLIVLAVAICVALSGVIGFVGLIVPHILRMLTGPDHRILLPASAVGGAALLTLADLPARLVLAPVEVPVGILTALVGGPFFLGLLIRFRSRLETW